MKIILGSQSQGRKELLSYLKIPFSARISKVDEEKIIYSTPEKTIRMRAKLKGEDIAGRLNYRDLSQPFLVISADSGAILGNRLIGKPKNREEAMKTLSSLSGKTHEFITSIYIILLYKNIKTHQVSVKKTWAKTERSSVTFRDLRKEEIDFYLFTLDFKKYAASYNLSTSGQSFISKIDGSLTNVIGLPLEIVIPILKEVKILD